MSDRPPLAAARELLAALGGAVNAPADLLPLLRSPAVGDELRALLAAWDDEHPGAIGERFAASVGGGVWTVAEARGDDLVLRDERGSAWEVSPGFLAAEVRAGLMRRVP